MNPIQYFMVPNATTVEVGGGLPTYSDPDVAIVLFYAEGPDGKPANGVLFKARPVGISPITRTGGDQVSSGWVSAVTGQALTIGTDGDAETFPAQDGYGYGALIKSPLLTDGAGDTPLKWEIVCNQAGYAYNFKTYVLESETAMALYRTPVLTVG